jgi:hypothetical protein
MNFASGLRCFVVLAMVITTAEWAAAQSTDQEAIVAAITQKYRMLKADSTGRIHFRCNEWDASDCTFFIPSWEGIRRLRNDTLTALLPDIRLYETAVFWQHFGPERIPVLISVRGEPGNLKVAYTLSPDMSSLDTSFLNSFRGELIAQPDQLLFVQTFGWMVAAMMPDGDVIRTRQTLAADTCFRASLRRTDARYFALNVVICFTSEHLIDSIIAVRK